MDKKIAIVTGGSSGIGLWAVHYLAEDKYTVYELSRRENDNIEIKHLKCDVTDEKQVKTAIEYVIKEEGKIDLVINCAGFGISGAVEFSKADDIKRQFDVNFFGMDNVNRSVIPYLRQSKGRIINISSVAAVASIPFQTYYSSCKAAINSYTLALANELRPFGISVCAIMPGDTHTGFTKAREKCIDGDDLYQGRITRSVERMEKDELGGVDAKIVGKYIYEIATRKMVKPLYTVGIQYKIIVFLLKILPYRLSNYLIYRIYGQ